MNDPLIRFPDGSPRKQAFKRDETGVYRRIPWFDLRPDDRVLVLGFDERELFFLSEVRVRSMPYPMPDGVGEVQVELLEDPPPHILNG